MLKQPITKFYYPQCREIGCNGLLKIKLGDNFTLEYECDKNQKHFGKKIFFKTFEIFYLREKKIEQCSNCDSILDGDAFYKCKKCKKYFCMICFLKDEHIKKDINSIETETKKCNLHKKELNQYCVDCQKNICAWCLKSSHQYHKTINLIELIPTEGKINNIKNKIENKNILYEKIISSINKWEKTLLNKTHRIKQNLRDEISLLAKISNNFNQYFLNYTYYSIFKSLDNYINNNKSNEILEKLIDNNNFDDKKDIIFEYMKLNKEKSEKTIKYKEGDLSRFNSFDDGLIEKINNKYYFGYVNNQKKCKILEYNDKGKNLSDSGKCPLYINDKIYSLSISKKTKEIYICSQYTKNLNLIEYDLDDYFCMTNKNYYS